MGKTVVAVVAVLILAGGFVFFQSQRSVQQVLTQSTPSAQVLAGKQAFVYDFTKKGYDQALQSDKLIILYFYATWCPICKEEIPKFYEAFSELDNKNVVGFRVNFNDPDTDDDEKNLAREFGIAFQHTKIFIKNGQRVLKSGEVWEKERYLKEIGRAI